MNKIFLILETYQLEYSPRIINGISQIMVVLVLGIICVAFARFFNNLVFAQLFKGFYKIQNVQNGNQNYYKVGLVSGLLLAANSILSLYISFSTFLIEFYHDEIYEIRLVSIILTAAFLLWLFVGQAIIAMLSGQYNKLRSPFQSTINIIFVLGILLLVVNLICILNVDVRDYYNSIILIMIATFIVIRIFKNFLIGIKENISWYYIILYLCTLEILPLWLFYYYCSVNLV